MSSNGRGALWILAAAVTFTAAMSLVKFLGHDFPSTVQAFFRQLVGLLVLVPFIARDPLGALRTSRPLLMLTRSLAVSMAIILSYTSYQMLGLADANSLSFTRQLFLVPLAILVLGERVDRARVVATLVGFAGVVVILQPGHRASFGVLPVLCALGAAFLTAWSTVGVKSMSHDHTPTTLLSWSVIIGALVTLPPALHDWQIPSARDLALLIAMGALSTATQACYIRGMAVGEATVIGPIDYTRLIFASAFGYVFFAELPGWPTLVGATMIIGATLFITLRARRKHSASPEASPPAGGDVDVVP